MKASHKQQVLSLVLGGKVTLLLATVAASNGIDVDAMNVFIVRCNGCPEDLRQQSNRCGRRGNNQGNVYVIANASDITSTMVEINKCSKEKGVREAKQYYVERHDNVSAIKSFFDGLTLATDHCIAKLICTPFNIKPHNDNVCNCSLRVLDPSTSSSIIDENSVQWLFNAMLKARDDVCPVNWSADEYAPTVDLLLIAQHNVTLNNTNVQRLLLPHTHQKSYLFARFNSIITSAYKYIQTQVQTTTITTITSATASTTTGTKTIETTTTATIETTVTTVTTTTTAMNQ